MSTLRLTTISNQDGSATVPSQTVISGSAKAWVNFNGTGTVAIRASYNVTSITDNGTGDYTVNFTTALTDANYAVTGNAGFGTTSLASPSFGIGTLATSSARIFINGSVSATAFDYNFVTAVIFR